MASPSAAAFALTGDMLIDVATSGYYWNMAPDRTIRWSLSSGFSAENWASPGAAAAAITQIFSTFSQYANVSFQYAGLYASPLQAGQFSDINISLDGTYRYTMESSVWAIGMFPNATYNATRYSGAPGDVYININSGANALPSYAPGSEGYLLFMHEIGHALGLKHPHDSGGTGRPTLQSVGAEYLDTDWFSIMSYNDDNAWNEIGWDPATPMLMDVLAMQYLYGKNMQTNAGNTGYRLIPNNSYTTLWDAGGVDIIDVSSSNQPWTIHLPDVQLSSLVDTKAGAAYLTSELSLSSPHTYYWLTGDIEDVAGSPYADTIDGSSLNNWLRGNGGNDTIDGGAGFDVAAYSVSRYGCSIMKTRDGYRVSGQEGIDTLAGIEQIAFADSSINLRYNDPVQQLYVAYFGRAADSGGLTNFANALSASAAPADIQGLTSAYLTNAAVRALIDAFGTSAESNALYTGNTTSFVSAIFQNVLGRTPQFSGLEFWRNAIDSGVLTKGNAALSIMAGALANTTAQGALDAALINTKIRVASNFTFAIDTQTEVDGYRGGAAAATVRSMLATVVASTDSDAFQVTVNATLASLSTARAPAAHEDVSGDLVQLVGIAPELPSFA